MDHLLAHASAAGVGRMRPRGLRRARRNRRHVREYTGEAISARASAYGQARGVVMLAAGQRGLSCSSYTPQQVKGAVCGTGRADKDQVGRMVQALLALPEPPRPDHAADALAVAVCHANRAPMLEALG